MFEILTRKETADLFSKKIYKRGEQYFREGRVKKLYHATDSHVWMAKVSGTKTYDVEIEYDEIGMKFECNCPAFSSYEPCKHVAAALLEIFEGDTTLSDEDEYFDRIKNKREDSKKIAEEIQRKREEEYALFLKGLTSKLISLVSNIPKENDSIDEVVMKEPLLVDWMIKLEKRYYNRTSLLTIEMNVGPKRTYVVKNIRDFLSAIKRKEQRLFTKNFTFDPTKQTFSKLDEEMIAILQKALVYEDTYKDIHSSYDRSASERTIVIPPFLADEFLSIVTERQVHLEVNGKTYYEIHVHQSELPLTIPLKKENGDDLQLDLSELVEITPLHLYGYIMKNNHFFKITDEQSLVISHLMEIIAMAPNQSLPIANEFIETFMSNTIPRIEKIGQLEIAPEVSNKIQKTPLQAKAYIDRNEEVITVSLEFIYGEEKINPLERTNVPKDGPIVIRDMEKEQTLLWIMESASLSSSNRFFYTQDEEQAYNLLYKILPLLEDKADVYLTSAVKSMILPTMQTPMTTIEVDSSNNWLEVNFDMAGIENEMVRNILQSVVEKKKYYRLPNGAFVSLESEEFKTIQHIADEFELKKSQLQESIQLPLYKGIQIDEMINNQKGSGTKFGKQFRRLLNRLKNPEELEFDLPKGLQAQLRDYQLYGFQWFKTLSYYRFGGILADDMGLGKTIQSIAYILSEKAEDSHPTLIVAPASLVFNWKNEFQKFAPSLTVEVLVGKPEERFEKLQNKEIDVLITSYPTLRQDIEAYKEFVFNTLILDEAQAIKNYSTKTAKAVREINANTRFALSGTPIENSIDELWSIFQTVMPHFFPNQKNFRQLQPEKVAKMIRPFLLRRVKKDVLKELPDKIETIHYTELTTEQKSLYLAYLEKIQQESKESLEGEGFQKSRMKLLAGLTRLRQLCCHPSLFLEDYSGQSGKLQQLVEIIINAKENGKRMLIFSQFTSMLVLIREQLNRIDEPYFYLDGQTNPKDRVEMVTRYNEGEADIFLISLKAGNTGLNLTGADTVILYDLWWNLAVEEQAAGRAHRIGQKNVVQVIRLITQGTIEEKIYKLQQNKKELIETVVEAGDQAITSITEEEIREILNI
ncbi:SNF2 helicase associated domain-containing protein [Alkalihalobacillus sp. LMS39]|uniref:SNF2 helicase associated domain-containing protein n=1 Tax=Alkalihalobacillus sp. LMS39 TaxID=2924032 RepID=UPI001FB2F2E3|nr:SNF2 helicase associated domain-containing protein [Alkalihalobacillus sp. LMS39]UOE94807.1 SNF2 helicase associated domain-containing protein [Alkalihalobacillus sp. LMS39]